VIRNYHDLKSRAFLEWILASIEMVCGFWFGARESVSSIVFVIDSTFSQFEQVA
jgi:hypothetical protein